MPRYVYPPRPSTTIHPRQLPDEEARGCWIWQHKFNGDRCVVIVEIAPGKTVTTLCNRHGKFHAATKFRQLRQELSTLNLPTGTHYLDGELMGTPASETVVLFDILQYEKYLIGKTQEERLALLAEVCRNPREPSPFGVALRVSDHVWMSRHGDRDFVQHFEEHADSPLIEGLVLRRKGSTLDNWGSGEYEVDWQLRCRKPAKNYRF